MGGPAARAQGGRGCARRMRRMQCARRAAGGACALQGLPTHSCDTHIRPPTHLQVLLVQVEQRAPALLQRHCPRARRRVAARGAARSGRARGRAAGAARGRAAGTSRGRGPRPPPTHLCHGQAVEVLDKGDEHLGLWGAHVLLAGNVERLDLRRGGGERARAAAGGSAQPVASALWPGRNGTQHAARGVPVLWPATLAPARHRGCQLAGPPPPGAACIPACHSLPARGLPHLTPLSLSLSLTHTHTHLFGHRLDVGAALSVDDLAQGLKQVASRPEHPRAAQLVLRCAGRRTTAGINQGRHALATMMAGPHSGGRRRQAAGRAQAAAGAGRLLSR